MLVNIYIMDSMHNIYISDCVNKDMSNNMTSNQTISQEAKSNIDEIEQELETSSQYFKPKAGNTYVIKMDPQNDKILPVRKRQIQRPTG